MKTDFILCEITYEDKVTGKPVIFSSENMKEVDNKATELVKQDVKFSSNMRRCVKRPHWLRFTITEVASEY